MALLRAQVAIPRDTGLPEDVSVNTFHFSTTNAAPYAAARTAIASALSTFYGGFDEYLGQVNGGPASVKFYDLADPKPRAPLAAPSTFALVTGTNANPLPEEVAICLSFQGAQTSGTSQARRRGRVYLGPLDALSTISGGRVQPGATYIGAIRTAAAGLLAAAAASADFDWVVYSPTNAALGGAVEAWYTPVVSGWVDNAFDTQRRRGPTATTRVTF